MKASGRPVKGGASRQVARGSRKQRLQAVLLADSFMSPHRFRPFTKDTPKVLLPLLNVPMLEYSLEFLAGAGVEEIIILASSHADQIESYIKSTRWLRKEPDISVKIVVSSKSTNMGDALRHIAGLHLITSTFILTTGDIVSNVDLGPILLEHRTLSQNDKDFAMTMLFSETPPHHAVRSRDDDLCIAINHSTRQLVYYNNEILSSHLDLDEHQLLTHGSSGIDIHYNLLDTGIYICEPRILQVFMDDFDFKDLTSDYVRHMLTYDPDAVVPCDNISAHILMKGTYSTRIRDLWTYHTCSHDIVRRWVSPIVISNNLLAETSYTAYPNNNYRENNIDLARRAVLKGDCVIGAHSSAGSDTILHKVICGRYCAISNDCKITSSYIMANTTIGKGCTITHAFIGHHVKIGNNVVINEGAIIGDRAVIADNTVVDAYTTVTSPEQRLDQEESDRHASGQSIRYTNSIAAPRDLKLHTYEPYSEYMIDCCDYIDDDDDDDDDGDMYGDDAMYPHEGSSTDSDDTTLLRSQPSLHESRSIHELGFDTHLSMSGSYDEGLMLSPRPSSTVSSSALSGARCFIHEVIETMDRHSNEGQAVENILQELPTLRLTYNHVGYDVYICAVLLYIFKSSNLPSPNRGLYSPHIIVPEDEQAWISSPDATLSAETMKACQVNLLKWKKAFTVQSSDDIFRLVLPAFFVACSLNDRYHLIFVMILNSLVDSFIPREVLISFYELLTNAKTCGAGDNSLLHGFINFADLDNDAFSSLLTRFDRVVEALLEDDDDDEDYEDEDEDEDEDESD